MISIGTLFGGALGGNFAITYTNQSGTQHTTTAFTPVTAAGTANRILRKRRNFLASVYSFGIRRYGHSECSVVHSERFSIVANRYYIFPYRQTLANSTDTRGEQLGRAGHTTTMDALIPLRIRL